MKHYYVFLCLDKIPFLELILDQHCHAKEDKNINWERVKYIILDFKSHVNSKCKMIEIGKIKDAKKILTNQLTYIKVDITKVHNAYIKAKIPNQIIPKRISTFTEKLFFSTPAEFLKYLNEKKLLNKEDKKKFASALKKMQEEEQILKTWKNVSKDEYFHQR